jgi:hypothetical protein
MSLTRTRKSKLDDCRAVITEWRRAGKTWNQILELLANEDVQVGIAQLKRAAKNWGLSSAHADLELYCDEILNWYLRDHLTIEYITSFLNCWNIMVSDRTVVRYINEK